MRSRLVTILPLIFGVLILAWFVLMPKKSPKTTDDAGAVVEPPEPFPAPLPTPEPIATPDPAPVATPSAMPSASTALAIADAAPDVEVLPEPLPELDAFFKVPPDSSRWTPDERRNYQDGLFEDLGRREAALERELAAADRRRDTATADKKRVTLEHLRSRRIEIVAGLRARDAA